MATLFEDILSVMGTSHWEVMQHFMYPQTEVRPRANKRTYKRLYVLLNLYERLYVVPNLHVCLSMLQNLHGRLYVRSYVFPKSFVHWHVKRKYNNNCPTTPQTPFSMAWDELHGHSRVVAHSLRSGRNPVPPILQYLVHALMVGPYANSFIIH